MELENLREKCIDIFINHYEKHIFEDLITLDNIQSENGNCSVPTLMLILSSLELFGFLISSNAKLGDTKVNIRNAITFNNYFDSSVYDSKTIDLLVDVFRHGVMHSFYPSQRNNQIFGVKKGEGSFLWEDVGNVKSLNVNVLSKDFKTFYRRLYHHIQKSTDKSMLEQIVKSFERTKIYFPKPFPQTTIPYGVIANKSC